MLLRFTQVDVFATEPFAGNPVAVVHDADGLDTETMTRIARWTNLSETTFLLSPIDPAADYRVRIFTPAEELPFAGHPTLGTCHAWQAAGGQPADAAAAIQECAAGLIRVRPGAPGWAFAAPPLVRGGPADDDTIAAAAAALGLPASALVAVEWVDNGPGWLAVLVADPAAALAVQPSYTPLKLGVVALHPPGAGVAAEVRAFFPKDGAMVEDPVTGSLNASLAQWLLGSRRLTAPYVASQGTALGRSGRVHISQSDGTIWVAGATTTRVAGEIQV
jgi:PhzF family phenazine biosynthesis protein